MNNSFQLSPYIDLAEVEFHSFHWRNFNRDMLHAHQQVMRRFGLNVRYTEADMPHGAWLDQVIGQSRSKVVAIIEPDLIPLNRDIVQRAANYAYGANSFIGCAQASNHIHPASHIFASPAFFFITPDCYQQLGRPSFLETARADVAEELAYRAEDLGIPYRTLYPTCFEREPAEGIWRLGSYGYYGIGTVFDNSVYHLFQGRISANIALFVQRCHEVLENRFDCSGFIPCTTFERNIGRIVPPPQKRF